MNKHKTLSSFVTTTSGDFVNRSEYSCPKTYNTKSAKNSGLSAAHVSVKYSGSEGKVKIYTSATRKHDELLSINEKLKKLG